MDATEMEHQIMTVQLMMKEAQERIRCCCESKPSNDVGAEPSLLEGS